MSKGVVIAWLGAEGQGGGMCPNGERYGQLTLLCSSRNPSPCKQRLQAFPPDYYPQPCFVWPSTGMS